MHLKISSCILWIFSWHCTAAAVLLKKMISLVQSKDCRLRRDKYLGCPSRYQIKYYNACAVMLNQVMTSFKNNPTKLLSQEKNKADFVHRPFNIRSIKKIFDSIKVLHNLFYYLFSICSYCQGWIMHQEGTPDNKKCLWMYNCLSWWLFCFKYKIRWNYLQKMSFYIYCLSLKHYCSPCLT